MASGPNARGVGHVHFMFFMLISFALGSQSKPSFQWNMGFNVALLNIRNAHVTLLILNNEKWDDPLSPPFHIRHFECKYRGGLGGAASRIQARRVLANFSTSKCS